ncbi:uncharacterized protein STEHIDRAFT_52825 [Stereum hirsutum FP-91666 SS1]|uniref:uncharacterized protein n=1 Tax=Stereum hirsutum (strain FP-91666) TaxID=721885 RepID=UPI000440D31C|nr:uncharacterized protein STEHIDRAFT_52825 [Stereum hirsutum FP-91666 SS1]EIM88680.1 hypothetical protein STEHIDRAFT_52825 [Stereum hirsutum FP-91666 SS1]
MTTIIPPTFSIPFSPLEQQLEHHAFLASIGFLILIPIGSLTARYTRTFTTKWWFAHWIVNFLISGPVIFAAFALGYMATNTTGLGHFNDPHKKIGLTLLILYLIQVVLGLFIHFVRMPRLFIAHRPPQNYFHAILGLLIMALAAYQVNYGLTIEWAFVTGNVHPVPNKAKDAWLALIIVRFRCCPRIRLRG